MQQFIARQLARPTGLIGQWIAGPLWNRRNVALNDTTLARLAAGPADQVLEVGFGGGYLLGRLTRVVTAGSLAGVDLSAAMVNNSRRRFRQLVASGRLDLRQAPAEALPFPDAQFTRACSVNSLFSWAHTPQALRELWRVLRADGLLVLCFTAPESLRDRAFARHGLALYSAEKVCDLLTTVGFREITTERLTDRHRTFFCVTARK